MLDKKKKKAFKVVSGIESSKTDKGSTAKNLPANTEDMGSIPELRWSPGEENGSPLQNPCLGNLMDRGAWQAIVYGVAKSQTRIGT